MKEVHGRVIAVYAEIARARGVDQRELFLGLDLDPRDLDSRFDFTAVATLLERLADMLGGASALEDAFVCFEPASPDLVGLAGTFDSALALARFLNTTLGSGNFSNWDVTQTDLSPDHYDLRLLLEPGYSGNSALIHATVGLLRGQPRLLGLPEARVVWSGTPNDFTCRVTLPTQASPPRARSQGTKARARAGACLSAMLDDTTHYRRDAERLARVLVHVGCAAGLDPSRSEYAEAVVQSFRHDLEHRFTWIWSIQRGARKLLASHGEREAVRLVLPLSVGSVSVGVIETDPRDGLETLQSLAPLLALGLRPALDPERIEPRGQGDFPPGWRLTKRQREVAELVAAGQSNPEVAGALGCTVGTVEDHLTAVYGKAGVGGRQALVKRLFDYRR